MSVDLAAICERNPEVFDGLIRHAVGRLCRRSRPDELGAAVYSTLSQAAAIDRPSSLATMDAWQQGLATDANCMSRWRDRWRFYNMLHGWRQWLLTASQLSKLPALRKKRPATIWAGGLVRHGTTGRSEKSIEVTLHHSHSLVVSASSMSPTSSSG